MSRAFGHNAFWTCSCAPSHAFNIVWRGQFLVPVRGQEGVTVTGQMLCAIAAGFQGLWLHPTVV